MQTISRAVWTCALAACLATTHAVSLAQDVPPPPAPSTPPAASTDAPAPAADATTCLPACREGYACVEGRCIEACNPPCPMGTLCTSAGECIADAPPPPPTYATAPPTYPEEEEMLPIALVDPGARRHDGFMFRVAVGFGGGAATESAGASEARFTGLALQFSLDVGGAPAENLVLHARIADMVILNPNVTLEDPLLGTTDLGTLEDVSLSAMLFGPGITYYFMPVNLYLTGAVGMSYVTVSDRDDSASSDIGVGVNVDFGKEWWIGRYWGIGVAGRFAYSHVTNDSAGVDSKIDFVSGGVLFSATYQ